MPHADFVKIPIEAGFPGGSVVKNPSVSARDARDLGLIPGLGRSPGGGNGNPLQYSCLENPMDRRAWQANSPRGRKVLHMTEHLSTWSTENNQFRSFYCFKLKVLGGDLKL